MSEQIRIYSQKSSTADIQLSHIVALAVKIMGWSKKREKMKIFVNKLFKILNSHHQELYRVQQWISIYLTDKL